MTWWQTLLISVAPVMLTLVITNYAEARRRRQDREERGAERADAAQREVELRRHSLQDYWRDQRFQHHQKVALMMQAVITETLLLTLDTIANHNGFADHPEFAAIGTSDVRALDPETYGTIRAAVNEVALLGTDGTRSTSEDALKRMKEYHESIQEARRAGTLDIERVNEARWAAQGALDVYRAAVRVEVGIDHEG